MKTQNLLLIALLLIACSIITWKAESTLFAVLAYILLIAVLNGILRNLVTRLDGL